MEEEMNLLSHAQNIWGQIEWMVTLFGLLFAAFLFLKDQLRRDRFMGFIPTVIAVVYDPKERKVLLGLLKDTGVWIFPQGRIQGSVLDAAVQILKHEAGLERMYRLLDARYLGRIKFGKENRTRLSRFMDPAEFTLVNRWRGKSYMAFFVETRLSSVHNELDGRFLYSHLQFCDLAGARERLNLNHSDDKARMYSVILDILEGERSG
jgi:hypothetical protein